MPVAMDDLCSDARGISARLRVGDHERAVSVRSDECEPELGDALACMTLFAAMGAGGGSLVIPAGVSDRLLERVPWLVELFRVWLGPGHDRVTVQAPTVAPNGRRAGTASFFSGGIDSFHTVLSRADELDELVFIRGFDLQIDGSLSAEATAHARAAAAELGLPLIEVDATLRDFTDGIVNWDFAHGPLLAAVAHALGRAGRMLVPATLDYRQPGPWGSHPTTDPWWSSDAVELVEDGVEATRLEKVALIAEHDVALRHLRVCFENAGGRWHTRPPDGPFNCGRCTKCLEAILALHLVGALERCDTLPHELDADAWAALPPPSVVPILQRSVRGGGVVGKQRDLLEHALSDPTVPEAITSQLRQRLVPFDRIENDPDFVQRVLVAGSAPVDAPTGIGNDATKPAGYRLADAASRVLEQHPTLRRSARTMARTVARWVDRAPG